VLRLIALTVEGAKTHDRWVGVCGGLAGDPFGAALLTGLGVTELSMTPRDIPAVKAPARRQPGRSARPGPPRAGPAGRCRSARA
jgi:phosphocarrier protein FPr